MLQRYVSLQCSKDTASVYAQVCGQDESMIPYTGAAAFGSTHCGADATPPQRWLLIEAVEVCYEAFI